MRLPTRILIALAAAAAGVFASPALAAAPATVKVVVAPVTSSGHPAAGFTVKTEHPGFGIDCSYADASRGALSPNIEECSPSAAYAIACWKAATPGYALCMQDPSKHQLIKVKLDGKFAPTAVAKPSERAPLMVVLTDGSRCQIRDGGAWGQPKGHPNLYGAYSCSRWGAAWLRAVGNHTEPHNGVNESEPSWTLRTVNDKTGKVTMRHIARAYFVATATE